MAHVALAEAEVRLPGSAWSGVSVLIPEVVDTVCEMIAHSSVPAICDHKSVHCSHMCSCFQLEKYEALCNSYTDGIYVCLLWLFSVLSADLCITVLWSQWIEEEVPPEEEKAAESTQEAAADSQSDTGSLGATSASVSDSGSDTLPSGDPATSTETDAKVCKFQCLAVTLQQCMEWQFPDISLHVHLSYIMLQLSVACG